MSQALYQKYRPQKFADLVNQNHIKITLENEIKLGKVSHAYLFTGPRGIGKTTTARLLAKSVNCEMRKASQAEPCNSCSACLEITQGASLDVMEMDAASHTGVDNVRENIIENVRFTPTRLKYKVFIIDEVHMLSVSAFNALLKTLEDPPHHAIFILATTEVQKVPETIISRCQRFDFNKVSIEEITKRLRFIATQEKVNIDDQVIETIAIRSGGFIRDAESLLGQIFSLGAKKITVEVAELVMPQVNAESLLELMEAIISREIKTALGLVNELFDQGTDLVQYNSDLVTYWRKLLLVKILDSHAEKQVKDLPEKVKKTFVEFATRIDASSLTQILKAFMAGQEEIKKTDFEILPFEIAILEATLGGSTDKVTSSTHVTSQPDLGQPSPDNQKRSGGGVKPKLNTKVSKKNNPSQTSQSVDTIKPSSQQGTQQYIGVAEVINRWQEIVEPLKKHNHSLHSIMNFSHPLGFSEGKLTLGFEFPFHKERLIEAKNKNIIENIISEVLGVRAFIEARLLTEAEKTSIKHKLDELKSTKEESLLGNLLEDYGGKVVN
jgi:DNA polymerase III subunit gamma/tau